MKDSGRRGPPAILWIIAGAWSASLAVCAVLWVFRIGGDLKNLNRARQRLEAQEKSLTEMRRSLEAATNLDRELAIAQAELYSITNAHVITPLLNSYAMRAKELLAESAEACGFAIADVRERYRVPFPTVSTAVDLYFDRIGIEVSGTGSYEAIAAFVAGAEESLPYAAVAGLAISSQRTTPLRQRATIVFEWPVKGVKPLPPPVQRPARRAGARSG